MNDVKYGNRLWPPELTQDCNGMSASVWLAGVVVVAMVGNVFAAGLAGSVIPLALRRAGQDPVLASAIWLTTFTDMFGFVLLLELGTLLVTKLG